MTTAAFDTLTLIGHPPVDWTALLGLHLQMVELEQMLALIASEKAEEL